MNPIGKMFEYNLWANTQLMMLCSGLSDEQLAVEVTGVFGRIQPTLAHLVSGEGAYLNRLTGSRPWADDIDWDSIPISSLLEMVQHSSTQLVDIASKVDPEVPHTIKFPGTDTEYHFFNWTVLLQALYHGVEHRTQVKILLTQLGVEHPELAAWDYMDSL